MTEQEFHKAFKEDERKIVCENVEQRRDALLWLESIGYRLHTQGKSYIKDPECNPEYLCPSYSPRTYADTSCCKVSSCRPSIMFADIADLVYGSVMMGDLPDLCELFCAEEAVL